MRVGGDGVWHVVVAVAGEVVSSVHDEARQLFAAIVAAPTDDDRRMVYADWLLARGDRLGELIIAQLEQARTPDDVALNRRVAALISAHRYEVIGDLPLSKPVFRRGFVEAAEISASDFLRVGAHVFERLPLLTELVIWIEREPASAELCGSPLFAHLRTLRLRYARGLAVAALADNPALAGLHALELTNCGLTAQDCSRLAASPHLAGLRSLELGSDPIHPNGVASFNQSAFAPRLRHLRVWKAELGGAGGLALGGFGALDSLELGFNGLDGPALAALAALAPTLRSLSFRGDRLGAAMLPSLAPLRLTQLDLEGVRITDAGVAELAKLELGALETLNLSGNQLTSAGIRELLRLPLPRLARLVLRHNELGSCARLFANKLLHTRVELDETVLLPGR